MRENIYPLRCQSIPHVGICIKINDSSLGEFNHFRRFTWLGKQYIFFGKKDEPLELAKQFIFFGKKEEPLELAF